MPPEKVIPCGFSSDSSLYHCIHNFSYIRVYLKVNGRKDKEYNIEIGSVTWIVDIFG